MEDLKNALSEHADLAIELFEKLSEELRRGFHQAADSLFGFFHAINWKEPWLIFLIAFQFILFLVAVFSRKNEKFQFLLSIVAFSGIYFAERLNAFLAKNWKSFSSQNYFDSSGLFISVLWSGPLLLMSVVVVVNTLFTVCQLIVKWKRAELRYRARASRDKQD